MRSRAIALYIGIAVLTAGLFGSAAFFTRHAEAQTLTADQRAALQSQYDELEAEIAQQQAIITQTQAQEKSLNGDVTTLNAQIKAAQAQIAAKQIAIQQISSEMAQKDATISALTDRIDAGKESLASLVRQEDQLDDYSLAEVAFGAQDISGFFSDLDTFASIENNMQDLFSNIQSAQAETETEKQQLADQQNAVVDAVQTVQSQKDKIAASEASKQQLLAITTNQESQYQTLLAANQAKAAAIKAALFPLRDSAAISFGDALAYAKEAQASTGVDPAFILAVLTQESNLGANVGQCYLTNDTTGAGVGKNTGTPFADVMKPSRDVAPFLAITASLGINPATQVVSCPQGGGYGGAMGPAQFIASTWTAYEARVAAATGDSPPDPWNAKDAIAAMSLYFEDLGAGAGTYTAEHTAAAKYYAGGAWATSGQAYGDSVMAKTAGIQANIDFLNNNS